MDTMPNFPHEMLREIYEQPEALARTIALYLDHNQLKPEVTRSLASWANPAGEVLIAASGSSRHSGRRRRVLQRIQLPRRARHAPTRRHRDLPIRGNL
jgi:glucosamine--fructose-6-phosphate aminotransferase (isomerizing)